MCWAKKLFLSGPSFPSAIFELYLESSKKKVIKNFNRTRSHHAYNIHGLLTVFSLFKIIAATSG